MDSDNCPIAVLLTAEGVTDWLCGVTVYGRGRGRGRRSGSTRRRRNRPWRRRAGLRTPTAGIAYRLPSCSPAPTRYRGSARARRLRTRRPTAGRVGDRHVCGPRRQWQRAVHVPAPLRRDRAAGRPETRLSPLVQASGHVAFRRGDALSGFDDCPPVLFGGPDGRAAPVIGACRDMAGNVRRALFPPLRRDAAGAADVRRRARPRCALAPARGPVAASRSSARPALAARATARSIAAPREPHRRARA